jgi:SAM-dependent methyltransferase
LDIDPWKLRIAKYRIKRFNLKAEVVLGDAHQLPFRKDSFDAVFSNQVIEHVSIPVKVVLEKLRVSRFKAILISGNNLFARALPILNFIYYKILKRSEVENVPDIGSYGKIFYINHQIPPFNSKIAILFMGIAASLPLFRRILAGNVVKVYYKRSSLLKKYHHKSFS